MLKIKFYNMVYLILLSILFLISCSTNKVETESKVKIVCTTTIVQNIVSEIIGEDIQVDCLLPVGVSPHGFRPNPRDVGKIAQADLIFLNGAGLESFLNELLTQTGAKVHIVSLSDSIHLPDFQLSADHNHQHGSSGLDPHIWMDPVLVKSWVNVIRQSLIKLLPDHENIIQKNAGNYHSELDQLHHWIVDAVKVIPAKKRLIVSDHITMQYFIYRYGFKQAGQIIPGFSTLSTVSARDLTELTNVIKQNKIQAIFMGINSKNAIGEQLAEDLNIKQINLYSGSLSEAHGEAGTYIQFMKYNVRAIVNGLN